MSAIENEERIEMSRKKIVFLGLLGAIFFLAGYYLSMTDPGKKGISFEYLGIGTWVAGIVFFTLYPKYKEIVSFILGLLVLHAGVLLILKDEYSNLKIPGFLVFTAGVFIVLSSGLSDYLKNRKKK